MTESRTQILNHGQISSMVFPPGWVEGSPVEFPAGFGNRYLRKVHPLETPDVKVCFYYRGRPCRPKSANAFRAVLEKPTHVLTQEEKRSIAEILGDMRSPNDFTMLIARTEDRNGKRILLVEGRFKAIQNDRFEIFVDGTGNGRNIQEIYYQAPKDRYINYLNDAKASLASIVWKN